MKAAPTKPLRDSQGNTVPLAPRPFAVGGEGAVFDVPGRSDVVAKIYSKPQTKERCEKLRAMALQVSDDLLKIAAWPTATLHRGSTASVDGILMPRIAGFQEIHHLYSVACRKKDFPNADWGFLLHTARNCAIAFEAVHRYGHVVGDVNQKNVLVSPRGIVAFVDCDSFQVKQGSRVYRCGVGVPEYTPPELHGKNFSTFDRDPNHDLFGLAVLIFHLVMMGRHPFSGVPTGSKDIPLERAIQAGLFAYSRTPGALRPPPHVPPMSMLDPATLELFDRAFNTKGAPRPTATEWKGVLDTAMQGISRCPNDPKHSFLKHVDRCPWCSLIATARLMFFLPGTSASTSAYRPADLAGLVRRLDQLVLTFHSANRSIAISRSAVPCVSLPPGLRGPTPRPALQPLPPRPADPPKASPPPTDRFLIRLFGALALTGLPILYFAPPVGIACLALFGLVWMILKRVDDQNIARMWAECDRVHQVECERLNDDHNDACAEVDGRNRGLMGAWNAANQGWVAQEKLWRQRADESKSVQQRIEGELKSLRSARQAAFEARAKEARWFLDRFRDTAGQWEQDLASASSKSRQIQIDAHLDSFLIRDAKLRAMTLERVLSLESFGIETARDVAQLRRRKVPGIGPVLTQRLEDWRKGLAARFTPRQTLLADEQTRITGKYAPVLMPLEQSVKSALADLGRLIREQEQQEHDLVEKLETLTLRVTTAEAHLAALHGLPA